jgi:hypothetical protein
MISSPFRTVPSGPPWNSTLNAQRGDDWAAPATECDFFQFVLHSVALRSLDCALFETIRCLRLAPQRAFQLPHLGLQFTDALVAQILCPPAFRFQTYNNVPLIPARQPGLSRSPRLPFAR